MLSALLLLQTPSTPYSDLWIPECKDALSVEGPRGYRSCAEAANQERVLQLELRDAELRELLTEAQRNADLAQYDADIARFESYRDQHCDYVAKASGPASVLTDNRELSCRYYLNDRRIAELDTMILLLMPAFPQQ